MKKTAIRLLSLILALTPLSASAQSNIKAAFDAIINCPEAEIAPSHFLQRDPQTGFKSGQDDIYRFILPASKMGLIKKAQAAFEKDVPNAYAVKSGRNDKQDQQVLLHSEEGVNGGIVMDESGREFIYSLFLPSNSEDPYGKYRYAYGMNFKEENGQIVGKLVINYATTLKYRQSGQTSANQFQWRDGSSSRITTGPNGVVVIESSDPEVDQPTWFSSVMKCLNGMSQASYNTRLALATKAYTIITEVKKYHEVTMQDKEALRSILRAMRNDGKRYSDPTLQALLLQCENAIK